MSASIRKNASGFEFWLNGFRVKPEDVTDYIAEMQARIAELEGRTVTDEQIKIMVERAESEVHSMFDRRANNTRAIAERVIRAAIQTGK